MKKQTKKPSKTALMPEAIATKEVVTNCDHQIAERIMPIRGVQVMLDCDLAKLYGVEVKQLNRQVKRNIERFPSDFMFQLSEKESKILKCQFGTSSFLPCRPQAHIGKKEISSCFLASLPFLFV